MLNKKGKVFKTKIGDKEVEVILDKYVEQANASCMIKSGGTVVLVNATMSKDNRNPTFLPLSVDYEEKMYSVGKIPGGFKKREGMPADKAILTARLIDRPLRPLFDENLRSSVGIVATVLSVDPEVSPEPLAMFGSSLVLTISDIPFNGPTGSVTVGRVDGKFIVNPSFKQIEECDLDLTVAGTDDNILMVEAGANEVDEADILDAILFGHKHIKEQVKFQKKLQKELGKEKTTKLQKFEISDDLIKDVDSWLSDKMNTIVSTFDRTKRSELEDELEEKTLEHFREKYPDMDKIEAQVMYAYNKTKKAKIREQIIKDKVRPDGRKHDEVRPIWTETGILPRVHGSAVFTRGSTQALTILTLGLSSEMQRLDGLDDATEKRYMHHYNFPGYSVGEARPMRGPGRREIGHGTLAERALLPVLPSEEEFPYSIRTVSEILSSNGSTSQASVCGSTLALMDGGVPIKSPVAGIAMGLIKEGKDLAILTDIQGMEDFLGDMDFKVAGTKEGITAIQMDIKINGIDKGILSSALESAKQGRLHILKEMNKTLKQPKELSEFAPKIVAFQINPDKIGAVVGSGGKVINKIISDTDVKIDITDEGKVSLCSDDEEMIAKAKKIILSLVTDPKPGDIYEGKVIKVFDFGALVEFAPSKDGMVHISKLAEERVNKVTDIINVGDNVKVEVLAINKIKGRVELKLVEKI